MQEVIEEVKLYLQGIWLKRRYIILATWLICPVGWLIVSALPDSYESKASVYADTQSILKPLLKGLAVESDPRQQIRLMQKTLLSRPNLERIARDTDMDLLTENQKQFEALIDDLKSDIIVRAAGRENFFTISYRNTDPEKARDVVQAVLRIFVENSLGQKREDTDTAQKFLEQQIEDYEQRLLDNERKLAEFKQKNAGLLPSPSLESSYYSRLTDQRELLAQSRLELSEAETELASSEKQFAEVMKNIAKQDGAVTTEFDDRIKQLEEQLDQLTLRFTDQHPDVVEVRRRVGEYKKQRDEELEALSKASGSLDSLDNELVQKLRLNTTELSNRVAGLKVRVGQYDAKVSELEEKVHIIPQIEAELTALTRNYEITRDKYEDLLTRRENARISQRANQSTEDVRFRVVDPPRVPLTPAGPKRLLLLILVTFVGAALGLGLSFLLSQLNPVVFDSRQLSRATGLPVFGLVSASSNSGLANWQSRKALIFLVSNAFLLIVFAGFIALNMIPELSGRFIGAIRL